MSRRRFILGGAAMAGDGLVRPLGAPPAGLPAPGVQPGVNGGVVTAHFVIVSGASGGVFVYTGTPAAGNPPVAWVSNGTVDPYGNALPDGAQMGLAGGGTFLAGNTLITPNGVYVYRPSIGAGKLVASFGTGASTDPFGDSTWGQVATYGGGGTQVVQLTGGRIAFDTGNTTYINQVGSNLSVNGNTVSWAFNIPVQDAFALQPGTTNALESWHNMTLLNSWANNGAFGVARYRKLFSPANTVEIDGALSSNAATAATFFTLPAGYIPGSAKGYGIGNSGGGIAGSTPNVRCDTSGNLTVNNATVPSASTFFIHGYINLDT